LALIGNDEEEDPDLRVRCKERLGAISPNGPPDAYAYIAKAAKRADGSFINVTRVRTENSGGGQLIAYVGKVDSEVAGTMGDLNTDLGCVDDAMQKLATPQCITLTTISATAVGYTIAYEVSLYDTVSATNAEIIAAIEASVVAAFASTPIGGDIQPGSSGRLYLDKVKAAIFDTRINGIRLPIFRVVTNHDLSANPFPLNINEFPVLDAIGSGGITRIPYGQ
jgi:phage-related baseplate assembly protein